MAESKEGQTTKSSLMTAGPNNQDLIVNTCDVNLRAEAQLGVLFHESTNLHTQKQWCITILGQSKWRIMFLKKQNTQSFL